MRRAKNSVDDVEVSALKAVHHLSQEIRPFLRKVLSPDDADCITQLQKGKQVISTASCYMSIYISRSAVFPNPVPRGSGTQNV